MTEEIKPFRGRFLSGGYSRCEDEEKHGEEGRDDRAVLCRACARGDLAVDTGGDAEDPDAPPAENSTMR